MKTPKSQLIVFLKGEEKMAERYYTLALVAVVFTAVTADPITVSISPTLPSYKNFNSDVTQPPVAQNTSVCYRYVGCFDNYPPFDNTGGVLPSPPERLGTIFLLYTPSNKKVAQQIDYKDKAVSLKGSYFDSKYPTKFIIHGFSQDEREDWLHEMKDALLTVGPMNVFIVGWSNGAAMPDYPRAVANTRIVGKQIELLVRLLQQQGMDYKRIHLIGHSLGAHISGYAGAALNGQLGRISGMDPAGPLFEGTDDTVRLNPTDAKFVDVIHSNAAPLVDAGAGLWAPSGHVDFYPNGGKYQPGCPSFISGSIDAILSGKFENIEDIASCSHSRSHQLYIESIPNKHGCALLGGPCTSSQDFEDGKCQGCGDRGCSELGYHSIEFSARGTFYLFTKGFATANAPPGEEFCGLTYEIQITPVKGTEDVTGKITLNIKGKKSSITASYQGEKDELESDNKVVIVDYEKLGDLLEVDITYDHYQNWFFGIGSGTEQWNLQQMTIWHNDDSYKFCSNSAIEIKSGKTVTLKRC